MADLWEFRSVTFLTDEPDTDEIAFDLIRAFEPAEVGGKDWDVPRRPGMIVRPRFEKRWVIVADGHIKGLGSSAEARWQSWRTATDSMFTALRMNQDPADLNVFAPYLGLTEDKTTEARCIRVIPGEIHGGDNPMQYWRFELLSVVGWSTLESA